MSGDFQGCRGCLQKLRFGPRNDPAWMPGLGEGHHGRVYDEPDSGTNLNAHHGVRKFVGSFWIKRKWGRPLIFAYFFLWASKGKSKWTKGIWFRKACAPQGCGVLG